MKFLSTLSLRRATSLMLYDTSALIFLSTLSLRRATQVFQRIAKPFRISIHALLAESDRLAPRARHHSMDFYPRSPCGERHRPVTMHTWRKVFLSTLSLRRATRAASITPTASRNFYPRSPCGERPKSGEFRSTHNNFYPRSPCGERPIFGEINARGSVFLSTLSLRRATRQRKRKDGTQQFLSTLSLRRATASDISAKREASISIHALLAESDLCGQLPATEPPNFYPRSPCGERLTATVFFFGFMAFLSTLSLRRATRFAL